MFIVKKIVLKEYYFGKHVLWGYFLVRKKCNQDTDISLGTWELTNQYNKSSINITDRLLKTATLSKTTYKETNLPQAN